MCNEPAGLQESGCHGERVTVGDSQFPLGGAFHFGDQYTGVSKQTNDGSLTETV